MKRKFVKKIYIDPETVDYPLTQQIIASVSSDILEFIPASKLLLEKSGNISLGQGKKIILVSKFEGDFLKPCPGTSRDYLCCQYHILNPVMGCPLNCSYCILQAYLNNPFLRVYANLEDMFNQVSDYLGHFPGRLFRIGTGELTDSLALESLVPLSQWLIEYFADRKDVIFEFKTKTDDIDHLLDLEPPPNLVVSWSLNPQKIIQKEEGGTVSLERRIRAAQRVQRKGYKVGFHFDPLLIFPGWEEEYRRLLDMLFSRVSTQGIIWISLGSLRFPPSLKEIIQKRFPSSRLIYEEMIRGLDGKMRYLRPTRLHLYKKIINQIKQVDDKVFCYLCMESADVWRRSMGFSPQSNAHLDFLFAQSIEKRFQDIQLSLPDLSHYSLIHSSFFLKNK